MLPFRFKDWIERSLLHDRIGLQWIQRKVSEYRLG